MNVIFKWLTTNVEWTPFSYIKAIFKPRLQTHRAINPEEKKITIWKSDFSKVADSQFTWKVKIYSFFKNIFPFLAHYGIFMISSILHVTWNYMLLILCASLSLYTLLTWRKTARNALLSIGLMGRPCPGLFIVWVPKAKAKYPMKSQMCNKNIIFNDQLTPP